MQGRDALHELVDELTPDEADAILEWLKSWRDRKAALDLADYPRLADIWDNDEDSVFDELHTR